MLKKMTTWVLVLGLAVTSATAAQAQIRDDQVARALLGALLLYGLSEALNDDNRSSRPKARAKAPARHLVPGKCAAVYDTAEGTRRIVRTSCLNKSYRYTKQLPSNCRIRVFTTKGWIDGYRARCLRRAGFTIT